MNLATELKHDTQFRSLCLFWAKQMKLYYSLSEIRLKYIFYLVCTKQMFCPISLRIFCTRPRTMSKFGKVARASKQLFEFAGETLWMTRFYRWVCESKRHTNWAPYKSAVMNWPEPAAKKEKLWPCLFVCQIMKKILSHLTKALFVL